MKKVVIIILMNFDLLNLIRKIRSVVKPLGRKTAWS